MTEMKSCVKKISDLFNLCAADHDIVKAMTVQAGPLSPATHRHNITALWDNIRPHISALRNIFRHKSKIYEFALHIFIKLD